MTEADRIRNNQGKGYCIPKRTPFWEKLALGVTATVTAPVWLPVVVYCALVTRRQRFDEEQAAISKRTGIPVNNIPDEVGYDT